MNVRSGSPPSALVVYLHGRRIGVVTRLAGDRHIFAFEEDYVDDPGRPTLSLAFKSATGGLVTEIRDYRVRVPPFFSNLLPEGHLRTYLAARIGVRPEREFFLLHALGADLPGAVTVTSMDVEAPARNDRRSPEASDDRSARAPLRFSLAGVQLKFSAIMEATGGLTVPADGIGGSWIVKLPSARFAAVPQNEFVTMELARGIGIPVPRTRLVPVHEIAGLPDDVATVDDQALAVERFDRDPGGSRIHMEDFAQVFGLYPERKYGRRSCANIASVLSAEAGTEAVEDFVRRLVFSVLVGNADMHLKNWSPPLRGRRHAVAVARLRPAGDDSLPAGRPARAHVRRNEGHPWNHQGADPPVCGQGGPGRRSALACGAGDGGRDGRSVARSRRESHAAGRYPDLAGPSSHRRRRPDAGVRQAQRLRRAGTSAGGTRGTHRCRCARDREPLRAAALRRSGFPRTIADSNRMTGKIRGRFDHPPSGGESGAASRPRAPPPRPPGYGRRARRSPKRPRFAASHGPAPE